MMNSMQMQRYVWKVLYIQRVAELVRLVTVLRTASPVSSPAPPPAPPPALSPASSPDVQHFDMIHPRTDPVSVALHAAALPSKDSQYWL